MMTIAFVAAFAVVARLGWGDFQNRGGREMPLALGLAHGALVGIVAALAGIGLVRVLS